jgi:hypothetical protein
MRRAFTGAIGLAFAALALMAPAAFAANEDLMIREVFPAETGNNSYIELQAFGPDQNHLAGKTLNWTYVTPTGQATPGSYTIPSDVDIGADQMTVLFAAPGYSGPVPPDFVVPGLQLGNRFGGVCFEAGSECVNWGQGGNNPGVRQFSGIPGGKALVRLIGGNCSTLLERADGHPWQAWDFAFADPDPRNNASPIVEKPCEPNTGINDASLDEGETTADTSVRIAFSASPAAETTYECKLDSDSFAPCVSPVEYTGLADQTQHKFEVRAIHHGVVDQTPAALSWSVDTTASLLAATEDDSSGVDTSSAATATGGAASTAAAATLAVPAAQSAPVQRATAKAKKKHKKKKRRPAKRSRHSH